MNLTYVC